MKNVFLFTYSVVAYIIGFASLLFWILSLSHLIPEISIDRSANLSFPFALMKNIGLVMLFAVPHSVLARKNIKNWIIKYLPKPIERSTYVLQAGLLLSLLVWQWEPLGGIIWSVPNGTILYYLTYAIFFSGWMILFVSTFLIDHFDLFGLKQTFVELRNRPYTPPEFKVIGLYKFVRHPLYLGGIIGIWFTPTMSTTHLVFAILLTIYFFAGALLEERDLRKDFGSKYTDYAQKTPMMFPYLKHKVR